MTAAITEDMVMNLIFRTAQFAEAANNILAKFDDLDRGMRNVSKSTSFLNQTLSTFTANLGVKVVEAATRAFGILKEGFDRFVDFAKSAVLESARIEVQWRTLSMTAAKMGVTFDEVEKSIGDLRAAGIKTSEALQVMTQWLSAGLPSDKLKELSRAAQDLAVVLGTDSTQAMERFNWFVQTGNSELLRTVGIMQTSTQMEERFARSIGKTREQLTDQERRLARVNGLLEATATYAGAYEEAMRDPFKRMTSLVREFSNVVEAVGAIFVPLLGTAVDVASDALEKLERLFRVTKKEAKETGATIGEWKEGFLRLRAVVTAFANWFMSLWERLTSGFNEQTENMMDRFVNAIIRGVKAAANALIKFAQFLAKLFGGTAPKAVSEATTTTMTTAAATTQAVTTTPAAATETYVTPEERAKLLEKAVEAVTPEWYTQQQQEQIENMLEALQAAGFELVEAQKIVDEFFKKALPNIQKYWELTEKLNQAIQAVAKAKEVLAKAEERLEKASEKVYDIRRKIAKLELQWAEIPERFIRGRKRQLQLELQAAEHEEHERQKEVEAARERLQEVEAYHREIEQMTKELGQQIRQMAEEIAKQNEKYQEWLDKLQEASEIRVDEPIQAVADEFESLDDLTAGYLEEIEGQLKPAFASIELSVISIADSLGRAWEKAKGLAADAWAFLTDVRDWFDGLPEWAKTLLKGAAIAIAFNAITGGLVTQLAGALATVGFKADPTTGILIAALSILATLILTNKEELAKWFDPKKKVAESWSAQGIIVVLQKAVEWSPMNWLSGGAWSDWWDQNVVYPLTEHILNSESDVAGAVEAGVEKPVMTTFERMAEEIVGQSVVPEMVESILDWFGTLQLDLTPILDQLTAKLEILEKAFKGLIPTMKEFGFASGGNFKVIIVNLQNSTFGEGLSEWEVKDWIYEAIEDVV